MSAGDQNIQKDYLQLNSCLKNEQSLQYSADKLSLFFLKNQQSYKQIKANCQSGQNRYQMNEMSEQELRGIQNFVVGTFDTSVDESKRRKQVIGQNSHQSSILMIPVQGLPLEKVELVKKQPDQQEKQDFQSKESKMEQEKYKGKYLTFAQKYYESVGLLRCAWENSDGNIYITNFGTAFAVSPWLLLTCQHNLFYEKQHLAASSISFVPGINGPITQSSQVWQSQQQHFYRAKEIKRYQETFSVKPLTNELCLIVLERPLQLTNYVKIGAIKLQKYQRIEIIGYPSESYSKQTNIFDVVPKRSHLTGNIIRVQDERVIVHNMPTKVGHSGSPILALDDDNQVVAIGIHTHRGFTYLNNLGLFFTPFVTQTFIRFRQELINIHELQDQDFQAQKRYIIKGCQLLQAIEKNDSYQYKDQFSKLSEQSPMRISSGKSSLADCQLGIPSAQRSSFKSGQGQAQKW